MTIIEAVREWLGGCPLLKDGLLNVDFLPPEAASYSLDVTPVQPVLRRFIDGGSERQFAFVLATRTYYGSLVRQQLDNLGFFERFAEWVEVCSRKRALPAPGGGRTVTRMEVTTSGYVFAPDTDTARYQIQCRMVYEQAAM